MLVSNQFLSNVCLFGGSCNSGLLDDIFKVQERCACIILDAPFQARTLPLFLELGWLPINQICIERRLLLLKNILDGRAPDYLCEKLLSLKYRKSHNTRTRLLYRFPSIPRTNNMKRMFFYNVLKLWNNSSDNLVHAAGVKTFKKIFFDSVNSHLKVLKLTDFFSFFKWLDILIVYYLKVLKFLFMWVSFKFDRIFLAF